MSPVFRHGSLRLYLLRLLDEEPRHGYEVIRLLRDRFMGVYSPSPGTIYPRLARLEEEGLVTHDEVDGRKVYRITEAGREELRSRSDELDELEEELSASVSDIVREVREDVRQTVRSLREELTWAARESRRMGREMAADVREQAQQARDEARDQARQTRDDAREQVRQAKEQAREQARQAREDARAERDRPREPGGFPGPGDDERGAASGAEGSGPEAARRVHEQARRLRYEARRARDEAMGGGRLGDPAGAMLAASTVLVGAGSRVLAGLTRLVPLLASILAGLPRLLARLFLGLPDPLARVVAGLPGLVTSLVAGLPGLLAHVGGHLPAHPAGLTGRPGQLLAEAAHGLPDVLPDLADDVADRRGQFFLELVELVAAAAQFLAAGLGDPVDLTAVYLIVRNQALFLQPGQARVDRAR